MTSQDNAVAVLEFFAHVGAVLRQADLDSFRGTPEHVRLQAARALIAQRVLPEDLAARAAVQDERAAILEAMDRVLTAPPDDHARGHPLLWVQEQVTRRTKEWLSRSQGPVAAAPAEIGDHGPQQETRAAIH